MRHGLLYHSPLPVGILYVCLVSNLLVSVLCEKEVVVTSHPSPALSAPSAFLHGWGIRFPLECAIAPRWLLGALAILSFPYAVLTKERVQAIAPVAVIAKAMAPTIAIDQQEGIALHRCVVQNEVRWWAAAREHRDAWARARATAWSEGDGAKTTAEKQIVYVDADRKIYILI